MAVNLFLSPLFHPCSTVKCPLHPSPLLLHSSTTNHYRLRSRFSCSIFSSSSIPGSLPTLEPEDQNTDFDMKEDIIRGGEQVTSILEEMIKLLEDMEMDDASELVAVEIAAQGVIGKRVDEMESGFVMALDYMIRLAEKDNDDKVFDEMLSPVFVLGCICKSKFQSST